MHLPEMPLETPLLRLACCCRDNQLGQRYTHSARAVFVTGAELTQRPTPELREQLPWELFARILLARGRDIGMGEHAIGRDVMPDENAAARDLPPGEFGIAVIMPWIGDRDADGSCRACPCSAGQSYRSKHRSCARYGSATT
jgi:hypothetical protein